MVSPPPRPASQVHRGRRRLGPPVILSALRQESATEGRDPASTCGLMKGSHSSRTYISRQKISKDLDEDIQFSGIKVSEDEFIDAEVSIHPSHLKLMVELYPYFTSPETSGSIIYARKDHQEFYHRHLQSSSCELPRIFGMTASLVYSNGSNSHGIYRRQMQEVENLLNSKGSTVVRRQEEFSGFNPTNAIDDQSSQNVFSIREAAANNLKHLAEEFGPEWAMQHIILEKEEFPVGKTVGSSSNVTSAFHEMDIEKEFNEPRKKANETG